MSLRLKDFFGKKCFGKNRCWNNVRAKCPVAASCALKAKAERAKESSKIHCSYVHLKACNVRGKVFSALADVRGKVFLDVKGCLKNLACTFWVFWHGKSPCFLKGFSIVRSPEREHCIDGSIDGVDCLG